MKKVMFFLITASVWSCFSLPIENVVSKLAPFSQKVSTEVLKNFIDENSVLTDKQELKDLVDVVTKGEDVSCFSSLAYDLRSGWIHSGKNFGSRIFADYYNSYVAQFLLAAVVIFHYSVIQNVLLIQYALETLRLSIIDGRKSIESLLGKDSDQALSAILDLTAKFDGNM
jgi:hypothetical protein